MEEQKANSKNTVTMIVGLLIIVVGGYLAFLFYNKSFNATKPQILPPLETETTNENKLPAKHIVEKGDSLWSISENYYGSGYNWIDIKEANQIADANQISEGEELTIPDVDSKIADNSSTETPETLADSDHSDQETNSEKSENNNSDKHVVKSAESLWDIAKAYYDDGNKWVDIAKANNIGNPSIIHSGEEFIIPNVSAKTNDESLKIDSSNESDTTSYTVQRGDSLWNIAKDSLGDGNKWVDIAKQNNLEHPSVIHAGNKLTIPR